MYWYSVLNVIVVREEYVCLISPSIDTSIRGINVLIMNDYMTQIDFRATSICLCYFLFT